MKVSFSHLASAGVRATTDLVCDAERWGFDGAWIPDQPFFPDPFATVAILAGSTTNLTLGVGVTNAVARHPVQIARAAATVAEVAPGRFRLGIGTGNRREYLRPLGLPESSGPERVRQAVDVIRPLLAGERVEHRGDMIVADGVSLSWPTHARIPIFVAGVAPQILRVAGGVADGAILAYASGTGIATAMEHVRAGFDSPPPAFPVVAWAIALVTDDADRAYDEVRPFVAHKIAPMSKQVLVRLGLSGDVVERIATSYWEQGPGAAATHVTNQMIDTWVWIGRGPEVARRMLMLHEDGVTEITVLSIKRDIAVVRRDLRAFAESALPIIKSGL